MDDEEQGRYGIPGTFYTLSISMFGTFAPMSAGRIEIEVGVN